MTKCEPCHRQSISSPNRSPIDMPNTNAPTPEPLESYYGSYNMSPLDSDGNIKQENNGHDRKDGEKK